MKNGRLRKVVFPVAGLGTRFLPATKVVAKEMLPVLDRPLIQYAVDEAVDAMKKRGLIVNRPARKNCWRWCRAPCRAMSVAYSSPSRKHWVSVTPCCVPNRLPETSRLV